MSGTGWGWGADWRWFEPQDISSCFSQGLVLITPLYLSLVSFVKPSHKGCKVRLFSGYHHPSPIIDWGGRWCTVLLSPVCLLPLFYPATPAPTLELSAATRASPTKLFAAHCLRAPFGCALLFLFWGFPDWKHIPRLWPWNPIVWNGVMIRGVH